MSVNITVLTLFPSFFDSPISMGVIDGALERGLLIFNAVNLRDYSNNRHNKCDDYSYGGGPGMLMSYEPFQRYYEQNPKKSDEHVVMFTPTGKPLTQRKVKELSEMKNLTFVCGHYEGIDARVEHAYVDECVSVGDYVVSGGEFAALTLTDAISRYLGVLGNDESVAGDTFEENAFGLLEHDQFTRPREIDGRSVPEVLLGGSHALIDAWRRNSSLVKTFERRPDMFCRQRLEKRDVEYIFEYLRTKKEK